MAGVNNLVAVVASMALIICASTVNAGLIRSHETQRWTKGEMMICMLVMALDLAACQQLVLFKYKRKNKILIWFAIIKDETLKEITMKEKAPPVSTI